MLYMPLAIIVYIAGLAVLTWIRVKYGSLAAILAGIACVLVSLAVGMMVLWDWTGGFGSQPP